MADIVYRCYAGAYGTNSVDLSPENGFPTRPGDLGITKIVVTTAAATPPVGFWKAAGSCGRFELIIRAVS